jgi:hypothetical protein|tara:strand:+ start:443 stop:679 length:237 start_codon:yes stop_codon:yes gene_type:complete
MTIKDQIYPNPVNFRLIENLDNGDRVINQFIVEERLGEYYYNYNDEETGPFLNFDDAVKAASQFIIPGTIEEWIDVDE